MIRRSYSCPCRHAPFAAVRAALAVALALAAPLPAAALTLPWQHDGDAAADAAPAKPRPVVTEIVADMPAAARSVPGVIGARTEATLAFQTLGTMTERAVDVGDEVKAGDVLARLSADDLQDNVRAAEAGLAAAEVQLKTAKAAAERTRALAERNVASQARREQADRALASAQAALRQAQSELARARDAAGFAEMVAPFAGVVTGVLRDAGTVVSAGDPILTLASQDAGEAIIDLPEAQLAGLKAGDAFVVVPEYASDVVADTGAGNGPADDSPHGVRAVVDRIEPLADAATRTRRVRLSLDDDTPFRLGTLIRARRVQPDGPVLTVPGAALLPGTGPGTARVLVVDRQGDSATVSLRDVVTGPDLGPAAGPEPGGRTQITQGLAPGDEVVVRGVHSLTEGQAVGRAVTP